jgi:cardiolipin synthase
MSYLCAIAAAQKSIEIGNAYFVPDDLAIDMLVAARQRGVRVRVVVPAINDSKFGRAVSRSRWGRLIEAGVEFHEYLPAMYHAKTMVVDDVFVTVGSANFDNRSFSINDEDAINVIDAAVAKTHLRVFEEDVKRSRPIDAKKFASRPFYARYCDSACGLFRSQF